MCHFSYLHLFVIERFQYRLNVKFTRSYVNENTQERKEELLVCGDKITKEKDVISVGTMEFHIFNISPFPASQAVFIGDQMLPASPQVYFNIDPPMDGSSPR